MTDADGSRSLPFVKMHGAGNDYVYVDGFQQPIANPAGLARLVSDRRTGIGSDGLILIQPDAAADARMEMYNADGSRGAMCGNGLRCVAKFLFDRRRAGRTMRLNTDSGVIPTEIVDLDGAGHATRVRLCLGAPVLERARVPMTAGGPSRRPDDLDNVPGTGARIDPDERAIAVPLAVADRVLTITALSLGNPHCVIPVEGLDDYPVAEVGRAVQECGRFPDGVNVEFVERLGDGRLRQRTFERGSGETLACGSGAVAAAVAARLNGDPSGSIEVELRGGTLTVEWRGVGTPAFLIGPAVEVFRGEFSTGC